MTGPSSAQQDEGATPSAARTVVVELFTSQGCSSCPPADDMLGHLAAREDVIALGLHVDYWDYIGWEDIFGQSAFSDRQKAYARAAGHQTVYTPQTVISGRGRVEGHQPMAVMDLIQQERAHPPRVSVEVARASPGTVEIAVQPLADLDGEYVLHLVRYIPRQDVDIERGENAGRTITYHNIVTRFEMLTRWDGQGPLSVEASAPGEEPVVVLVQREDHGAILAADRLR
ncbi:DUF1223 domain-containing protein [Rhodobacteraceae bacterium WD3A24]|nr:DUF1223 domain-containing protein [Rhodobacteraceae bacterium WD3A24]